jgi:hypothetical protein
MASATASRRVAELNSGRHSHGSEALISIARFSATWLYEAIGKRYAVSEDLRL